MDQVLRTTELSFEIDPEKLQTPDTLDTNQHAIIRNTQAILDAILKSHSMAPIEFKQVQ